LYGDAKTLLSVSALVFGTKPSLPVVDERERAPQHRHGDAHGHKQLDEREAARAGRWSNVVS
jgi:hypothetical protein